MKIAFLTHGESIHEYRFLSKMVEYGHEPYLISYDGNNLVEVEGVKVYKYDYRKLYSFNRIITSLLPFQIAKKVLVFLVAHHFKKLLKEIKPDILHTHFIHYQGFCGALSGFKPTIAMTVGSDILLFPERSFFDNFAAKYTLKKADRIVCDCQTVRQKIIDLSHCSSQKIDIILGGADLNIFNADVSGNEIKERFGLNNKKVLIMNRKFQPVYGVEYFIEALPFIIKKASKVFALLIGEGATKSDCQKRVKEMGLEDHVIFVGDVSEKEMAKYLNAADVYVSTSLSDGASASLLEALACGLPVVVTDIPANREWIKDGVNGFLVPPRNPEKTAEAILKLLNDGERMKIFGQYNQKIAQNKADWDKEYQKLDKIYNQLVQK